ncbi:MAG: beta-N-acetylglucosaminidase domain-containing protein [Planctomycetes bacterium]|nr:beta-N-acetylglucosaminidase domain-containing protein [Planctomycetota bacterium]
MPPVNDPPTDGDPLARLTLAPRGVSSLRPDRRTPLPAAIDADRWREAPLVRAANRRLLAAAGPRDRILPAALARIDAERFPTAPAPDEAFRMLIAPDGDDQAPVQIVAGGARGIFYAVETLIALVSPADPRDGAAQRTLPAGEIESFPAFRRRGIVEGFYGPPWSWSDRARTLADMARLGLNTFFHAPKDDPCHRAAWRERPEEVYSDHVRVAAETAADNGVDWFYALHPGGSIRCSSDDDFRALVGRVEWARTLGVRHVALLLDDVAEDMAAEDRRRFASLPQAQAHLVNRLHERLGDLGIEPPLVVCPTRYHGFLDDHADGEFKRGFGARVHPEVAFFWTGNWVFAQRITAADAQAARDIYGHEIIVWDNYPVNDALRGRRLFLGPYRGREAGAAAHLLGVALNPMQQARASLPAIATAARFLWNPEKYDPDAALAAEIQAQGLGALQPLFERCQSSFLSEGEHPALLRLSDAWRAAQGKARGRAECAIFAALLDGMLAADLAAAEGADSPAACFARECEPFLKKLRLLGELAHATYHAASATDPATRARLDAVRARLEAARAAIPEEIDDGAILAWLTEYAAGGMVCWRK